MPPRRRRQAEIGLPDRRVGQHRVRRAVGDPAAGVQADQPVAQAGEVVDIVVDDQPGGAVAAACLDQCRQPFAVVVGEAGRRFVEQHQPRPAGQRPRDLDQPALAEGEGGDWRRGQSRDAAPLQARGRRRARAGQTGGAGVAERGVVDDVVAVQQHRLLEAAGEAARDTPVRRQAGGVGAEQRQRAGVGPLEPADQVQQRGLAGAVRTDQSADLPRRQRQPVEVDGDDAAEALAQAGDRERRCVACGRGRWLGPDGGGLGGAAVSRAVAPPEAVDHGGEPGGREHDDRQHRRAIGQQVVPVEEAGTTRARGSAAARRPARRRG
ncbi:MAG: hypothetical protein R3F55_18720 [Alphaproteobacteria bacterium]